MANYTEYKAQRSFVKDGDEAYNVRRPIRRAPSIGSSIQPHKTCECGGKLKPRGATGICGFTSAKCNKCGIRIYSKNYKGKDGLAECY